MGDRQQQQQAHPSLLLSPPPYSSTSYPLSPSSSSSSSSSSTTYSFPPPPVRRIPSSSRISSSSSNNSNNSNDIMASTSSSSSSTTTTRNPPPLPPLSTNMRSGVSPSASGSSSPNNRKLLLKIPNAKANRWVPNIQDWQFLALGDFIVYQVNYSSGNNTSTSSTSPNSNGRIPPPVNAPRPTPPSSSSSSSLLSPSSSSAIGIVIAIRNTELPLSSSTSVQFKDENTYILDNGQGYIVSIELETPRTASHTILDNVLKKYTIFNGVSPTAARNGDGTTSTSTTLSRTPSSSGTSSPAEELQPSDFKGSLLLIDEETGKILGPLNQSIPTSESEKVTLQSKQEVPNAFSDNDIVVTFPEGGDASNGAPITISVFDDIKSQYGKSDSKIVGAAEYVSKGMLFAAEYGATYTSSAAKRYTEQTKATETPLVFSQTTKNTANSVAKGTEQALKFTRSAVGFIAGKAEQLGSAVANQASGAADKAGMGGNGRAGEATKSLKGVLKNTLLAVSTVAEGLEKGGKHFLETGRQSTNQVVGHRWGDEARDITDSITSAGSNVVLVYVDARGVMHRALLKRVGKGALKARMQDGRQVVLDDSGIANQHTERDENGNLIVVDDIKHQDYIYNDDKQFDNSGAPPIGPPAPSTMLSPSAQTSGYQIYGDNNLSQGQGQGLSKRLAPSIPPRAS